MHLNYYPFYIKLLAIDNVPYITHADQRSEHVYTHSNYVLSQNKEGILPVATLNVTQLTVLRQRCTFSEAEVYIDVYKGDDNFVTSGATLLSDLDL